MKTPKSVLWHDRTETLRNDLFFPITLTLLMAFFLCICLFTMNQWRADEHPIVAIFSLAIVVGFFLYGIGSTGHILYRIWIARRQADPLESASATELQQMLDEARRIEADYLQTEEQLRDERQTLYEAHQLQYKGYQKRRDELTSQIIEATYLTERLKNQHQIKLYQKLLRAKTSHR